MAEEVIKALLKKRNIKKEKDVEELYLANRNLTEISGLERFRYLRCLWLNDNKLRSIDCLKGIFLLSELYLQNNQLTDITGCLHNLTCLSVLMLHNNQLAKLENTVVELSRMQALKTLNLMNNPLAQETGYRLFVIQFLPAVNLLDRKEVLKSEQDTARKIHEHEHEKIREKVAFGQRVQDDYTAGPHQTRVTQPDQGDVGNSYLRDCQTFEEIEDAVEARRLKKAATVYTSFDWSKIPKMHSRITENISVSPEIITHIYR